MGLPRRAIQKAGDEPLGRGENLMKIIKHGVEPEPVEVWPFYTEFTCNLCNCVFVIERYDIVEGFTEKRTSGKSGVIVACPTCGAERKFDRPTQVQPGISAAQTLSEAMGGFPNGGSAIS